MASHHLVARVGHVEVKCLVERVAQVDIRNVPMNRGGHCFFVSLFNSTNIGWADLVCCIATKTTDVSALPKPYKYGCL